MRKDLSSSRVLSRLDFYFRMMDVISSSSMSRRTASASSKGPSAR
jgi:hypothetical protein